MNRKILFQWPELGLCARAELADDLNPELCEEVWNALPVSSIINNAVVTDGSMYCWIPLLSFAPVRVKEKIDQAPPGRLRYSQNTGNKIIIQYGECNEDVYAAVLGKICDEDLDVVHKVGLKAKEAIFMTKEELHIEISRIEEIPSSTDPSVWNQETSGKSVVDRPVNCRPEVEELASEILKEALEASCQEPLEHKMVRTGKNAGMGSCGQYFSTWEFVYSLLRDLSMYTLYPIAGICRDQEFSVRQLEKIYMAIDPTYTNLLGSYGMRKLRRFSVKFRKLIEEGTLAKEEFTYLIDALTMYTNMMAQWAYFYYPWGIGCACYRFEDGYRTYRPEPEMCRRNAHSVDNIPQNTCILEVPMPDKML